MPDIERPDGAVIHYETFGNGFPLLCFAPGGVNSEIDFWSISAINPIKEFASDFMVIGMDQRNAGKSPAPARPAPYDVLVADQIAVLDDIGAAQAHTYGGCIGVAYILRIAQEAPARITAGVGQDPVGLNHTNSLETFMDMFQPTLTLARREGVQAVVEAALANPIFMANNAAGPFARRIHDDAGFREEIQAMTTAAYVRLIESYADALWPDRPPYFSVDAGWVQNCETPLLILPGSDQFHPTSIAEQICRDAKNALCLDVDCRSEAKVTETIEIIRSFLKEHTP
ncbi:MAG TPA: hypothetical protein DGL25_05965 [Dehalococcoidia bacterium]|nr:hypothetical protein [Dehalococcoidia bacterium]